MRGLEIQKMCPIYGSKNAGQATEVLEVTNNVGQFFLKRPLDFISKTNINCMDNLSDHNRDGASPNREHLATNKETCYMSLFE